MEVMGNVLDNACKYCLEFVEVSVRQTTDSHLHILVEDDGPGSRRASAGPFSTAASGLIRCVPARGRALRRP
jgi:two-component system sensor histidine kinase PhoQ